MSVGEVMTSEVVACGREDDLARATQLMWEHNCGILPVVEPSGAVVGVITDRDIAIASATRHVPPGTLAVGDVMMHPVHACLPDDGLETALGIMRRFRVRRLCVVDATGHLRGILSLDDIVLAYHANAQLPAAALLERSPPCARGARRRRPDVRLRAGLRRGGPP